MRLLFVLIGLLGFSLSVTATSEWLYYKHFPWVYDNASKDWLYLSAFDGGKIYAYRSSKKIWEEFNVQEKEKTWDEKYDEWIKNPEPYGGLNVLQKIKEAKDSGALELNLLDSNITDLTPLAELNNLRELRLGGNYINDLTPLANLTNLEGLGVSDNKIFDLTPLSELTALEWLHIGSNNMEDVTPLSSLKNLKKLWAYDNKITDFSPITVLTNLNLLSLTFNDITALQIMMLEEALPNTRIQL